MSRRATEQGAVNVGQGFPDYPIDPDLAACVTEAVAAGFNQYAPMEGNVALRAAIAAKIRRAAAAPSTPKPSSPSPAAAPNPSTPPSRPSSRRATRPSSSTRPTTPTIRRSASPAGAASTSRCEAPHFRYDWDRVRAAVNERTRLIVINNPHNPACTVASAADLDALAAIVLERARDRPIIVLADEVYEHVQYDGRVHQSVINHPALRERSFAVYSFGKTLHITGWRVGYCVAPAELTRELRKVHQFNTFSIAAPLQAAICLYLERHPDAWREVAAFFSAKRDLLLAGLAGSGLTLPPAAGSTSSSPDYGALGDVRCAGRRRVHRKAHQRGGRRRDPAVAVLPRAAGATCASCGCASPSATRR